MNYGKKNLMLNIFEIKLVNYLYENGMECDWFKVN